ncbi:hypothetical protein BV898_01508 [Hypsibius exemplaris]|uniref:Uncharacterized protein n=1 Tax=Hypsibius exemplaris TaxID=2072580 RepID=A0A1W0XAM1_HYPEX|nr:hypothetical protein BV898_01508 [Hypsibius exemplaris]
MDGTDYAYDDISLSLGQPQSRLPSGAERIRREQSRVVRAAVSCLSALQRRRLPEDHMGLCKLKMKTKLDPDNHRPDMISCIS